MTSEYRAGETIPGTQYRFVRALGAGGHGSVYEVEHKFLQAPAVMKLLHAQLADQSDLAQRMTREARTLAKLRHPNIVEVRDGGITDETPARPYFVMEPLNGMSLRELVRHMGGRGIGVLPALRILIGVLEGLQHAHRAGVIHRDIKPDNIYLHRTSTDVTVPKVLDFGIAHLLMGQRFTGRHFLGTPRYAAPEQLRGESPTACTDIYACGLVLYEMVTGSAPFGHLKEIGAILQAHLNDELPAASTLAADSPPVLDNFIASMVAKDPAERPPTAFAAAVALREIRQRIEAEQAGSMHTPEFKTEPTPMDNMLVEASPEEIPFVTEVGFPQGANDTTPDGAPLFDTLRQDLAQRARTPAGKSVTTEPMAAPVAPVAAMAAASPRKASSVDRSARTNTAKEPAPAFMAGPHDTEPLAEHPALADTTPVKGARRSPPEGGPSKKDEGSAEEVSRPERTPGAVAIALPETNAQRAESVAGVASRARSRSRARRRPVVVFAVTLGIICAIGLPLALRRLSPVKSTMASGSSAQDGIGDRAPVVAVGAPLASPVAPSATLAPLPELSSITPPTAAAASSIARPAASAPTAVRPLPVATASGAGAAARSPKIAPAQASRVPAAPKAPRPGDPAGVPFD